jgi:hypothetical protein
MLVPGLFAGREIRDEAARAGFASAGVLMMEDVPLSPEFAD